jgi:hypothetical protein
MRPIGSILNPAYFAGLREQMEAHKRKGDTPTDRALDDVAAAREADAKLASEIADVAHERVTGEPIAERVQRLVDGIEYDFTPQKAAE